MSTTTTATRQTQPTSKPRSERRAVNVTLWTVQVLLAVLFAFAAYVKFSSDPTAVAMFGKIGFGQWFRYLTGTLELAGAIGLLIPRLCGLAATGLIGVMVGAVVLTILYMPPASGAVMPAAVGVVLGLVAWARYPRTRTVIDYLRR
jgi:uncharacterized membrane protein YphA (DoxX/SURF4 family)